MLSGASNAAPTTYTISVLLCGYGFPTPDLGDPPCHVALAVHATAPQPSTCHLHHVRAPLGTIYVYEPRPSQPLAGELTVSGRCELRSTLSATGAELANRVLADFGADKTNLPDWGDGNCQDWMAGGVEALEKADLVEKGDGEWWRKMVGRSGKDMEVQWRAKGRGWVEPAERLERPVEVDARWVDKETIVVGELSQHSMFNGALQEILEKKVTAK